MAAKKIKRGWDLMEEVQRWGCLKQTGVSLRYMMKFGSTPSPNNLLISAQFLHKELPIRIARRALELDTLPFALSHRPHVLKVLLYYHFAFTPFSWFLFFIFVFVSFCLCSPVPTVMSETRWICPISFIVMLLLC